MSGCVRLWKFGESANQQSNKQDAMMILRASDVFQLRLGVQRYGHDFPKILRSFSFTPGVSPGMLKRKFQELWPEATVWYVEDEVFSVYCLKGTTKIPH